MQLLIVDDGHYVVEYLKHLLDWKALGIDHIETTTNSIEARDMLSRSPVDILITDIRMPEVSGIDLLQHIHENGLPTKVIFLSGYSQFDYAQQGIRLGALDYLLKPVDKDDMETAMAKAVAKIHEQYPVQPAAGKPFDGLGYLLSLLGENPAARKEFAGYEGLLGQRRYCFLKLEKHVKEPLNLPQNDTGCETDFMVWTTGAGWAGMIAEDAKEAWLARMEQPALSEPFALTDRDEVRRRFYGFFLNEAVCSGDFSRLRTIPPPAGEGGLAGNLLKKYEQLGSRKHQLIFLIETILGIYRSEEHQDAEQTADWLFHRLSNPGELAPAVIDAFERIRLDKHLSNKSLVSKVQAFIENHLDHSLSLDELSKVAHLHPVYLSKLFKQEAGENVSSFISRKRLEKASQLLLDSDLRVADISQMVGYKKNQYFIQLFKENYGVTPCQYRKARFM